MSIKEKELKAELKATRKKIAEQLSLVGKSLQSIDPTLYDKEQELERLLKHLEQHSMNKYTYGLCDGNGYAVLDIESGFTNLSYDAYFQKHIVPMLPALSTSHGTRVYLATGATA